MKTLPIGSVIELHHTKLMIAGHFLKDLETKNELFYITVPYPMGFVSMDKTMVVAVSENYEVVHSGYMSERAKTYTDQLDKVSSLSKEELVLYTRIGLEALKQVK